MHCVLTASTCWHTYSTLVFVFVLCMLFLLLSLFFFVLFVLLALLAMLASCQHSQRLLYTCDVEPSCKQQ